MRGYPAAGRRIVLALAAAAACKAAAPPSPLQPGNTSGNTGVLSGTLVAHLSGAPVSGATILLGTAATTTDAQGRFTLTGVPPDGAGGLVASAPGHVQRGVSLALAANRAGVTVDILRDAAPFSLDFYRAWVRDAFQSQTLQPTRPWTKDPNFYFKTVLEDVPEETVPDEIVTRLAGIFAATVPELSGGRRRIGLVERGTAAREPADGWVIVGFWRNLLGALGSSSVGGNQGTMRLVYAPALLSTATNNPYNCESPLVSVADHEITHIMGYWHTPDVFVDSFSGPGCTGGGRPEHVRLHSAIMYSRPPGNRDPDTDPSSAVQSRAPEAAPPPVVTCFVR